MVKIIFFISIGLLFINMNASYASLIRINDTIMYDDVDARYWISDLSLFENQNYNEQVLLIGDLDNSLGLTSDGWGEWNMASYSDIFNHNL